MNTSWLSWVPLTAAILAIGAAIGGLAVASLLPVIRPIVERLEPSTRFRAILALVGVPALTALILLKIAFGPSALDAIGLVADHCAHHMGHPFHLCYVHGVAPDAMWPLLLFIPFGLAMVAALAAELSSVHRAKRWARQLRALGQFDDEGECWLLEADGLAVTIGTFRPEVFASASLTNRLSAPQWAAVLAHEHAHRARRDGLAKSIARLLAALHRPHIRHQLIDLLDVASEQACDAAAAAKIGDPAEVAATIVAMERLSGQAPGPLAQAFATHPVELRVRALLEGNWVRPPRYLALAAGATVVGALSRFYEPLHHAFETALTYFL